MRLPSLRSRQDIDPFLSRLKRSTRGCAGNRGLGERTRPLEVRERRIGGVANGRVSADARNEEPDRAIKRGQTYNDPP
jgi:hypothetical protein